MRLQVKGLVMTWHTPFLFLFLFILCSDKPVFNMVRGLCLPAYCMLFFYRFCRIVGFVLDFFFVKNVLYVTVNLYMFVIGE